MNTDMNIKKRWVLGMAAALLFAAAPFIQGCEPAEEATVAETADHEHEAGEEHAHADETGDDHGHEHAEGEDHAHDDMAMKDDHSHEHADGEEHTHEAVAEGEEPTTVEGWMHAIAAKHTVLETADTDQALLDAHHVPFEIEEMFTKLRPLLELSEPDAAKYDELHGKIGQAAELIEKHSHEDDVAMVRTVLDKLNADIEALEKVAAPDHVH